MPRRTEPPPPKAPAPAHCALCGRAVKLTAHHLIPRKLHRRPRFQRRYSREQLQRVVMLCEPCHRGVHRLYDEMTLGQQFNTLDRLRDDPALMRHSAWVARQRRA